MAVMSLPWTASSAEGRWCGLWPYYAMFPVEFVCGVIDEFCPPQGRVLDPFCGRGTTTFVASVSGREAIGTEINPIGWIYATVKLDPCPQPDYVLRRVEEIVRSVQCSDRQPSNDFQRLAWHSDVLGFLNACRRDLNWRTNRLDRTVMALVLVYLHAKKGGGLSNQLRQSKAMAPNYAIEWWSKRRLRPPKIDVLEFFRQRIAWRYAKGIPQRRGVATAKRGDARSLLRKLWQFDADFVLTSPPYCGVTNYEYDNWIRMWMLGGPDLPSGGVAARFGDQEDYYWLLFDIFEEVRRLAKDRAIVYVRTDARPVTLEATLDVLNEFWPKHRLSFKYDLAPGSTQTALFQRRWHKAGEVDILLTPCMQSAPSGSWSHLL